MAILSWEKPKRKVPKEDWKKISADGAPPGVYTPNMSDKDMKKWKAKLVKRKGHPQVEIRKSTCVTCATQNKSWKSSVCAQVLIVVGLDGIQEKDGFINDVNVKISQNGPSTFTFKEIRELEKAIEEAKQKLEKL